MKQPLSRLPRAIRERGQKWARSPSRDLSEPCKPENLVERMGPPLDVGTDHVAGMHAEGDAVPAMAERKQQRGVHARRGPDQGQSIDSRDEAARPGVRDRRKRLAEQFLVTRREPRYLPRQQRVTAGRIPERHVLPAQ